MSCCTRAEIHLWLVLFYFLSLRVTLFGVARISSSFQLCALILVVSDLISEDTQGLGNSVTLAAEIVVAKQSVEEFIAAE